MCGFLLLALAPWTDLAYANDEAVVIGLGGLVPQKETEVAMEKEDLFVSADLVRVSYEFRNHAAKDKTLTVSFPLPDVEHTGGGLAMKVGTRDPVGFRLWVDDKPVKAELEYKTAKGEYETVHKYRYYWQQKFPAGKVVRIRHEYKPVVGGFMFEFDRYFAPCKKRGPYECFRDRIKPFCPDRGFDKWAAAAPKRLGDNGWPWAEEIHYILKSGANWRGQIKDFRLEIDKGDPQSVLTLCIDGIRKIGPTRFEVRRKNFTPTTDLAILIVSGKGGSPP